MKMLKGRWVFQRVFCLVSKS